jgi:hypothetical protein
LHLRLTDRVHLCLLVLSLEQTYAAKHTHIGCAKLLSSLAHRAHLRAQGAHLCAKTTKCLSLVKINASLLRGESTNALTQLAVQTRPLRADTGLRLSNLPG